LHGIIIEKYRDKLGHPKRIETNSTYETMDTRIHAGYVRLERIKLKRKLHNRPDIIIENPFKDVTNIKVCFSYVHFCKDLKTDPFQNLKNYIVFHHVR